MSSVLGFARGSASAASFALGTIVVIASALLGTSMISIGHLLGSALACLGLLGLAQRDRVAELTWRPSHRTFVVLCAWIVLGYAVQVWAYYWSGAFVYFDLGIFADLLASLGQRGAYYSAPMAQHGFADHFAPTLTLLAPLFWWKPTFLWLIFAKYVALLSCTWLLYAIGRELLGERSRALWVLPCLWLVHTLVAYAYLAQFQPSLLAPPLALLAFLLALRSRWVALCACLLVVAGLKEDQALIGVCVGMFLIVERRRPRLGGAIVLASLCVGALAFFVLMPAYAHGSKLVPHGLFGPWVLWPQKLFVLPIILATVGCLPLLHPRSLLFVVPALGVHFVANKAPMLDFRYHYQAVPTAIVFVAATHGLAAMQNDGGLWRMLSTRQRSWAAAAGLGLLITLNGMLPLYSARLHWPSAETTAVIRETEALGAQLDGNVRVYTSDELFVHLIPHASLHRVAPDGDHLPLLVADETEPHVVVLSTSPLHWFTPASSTALLQRMRTLASTRHYELEHPSEHLLLYRSR